MPPHESGVQKSAEVCRRVQRTIMIWIHERWNGFSHDGEVVADSQTPSPSQTQAENQNQNQNEKQNQNGREGRMTGLTGLTGPLALMELR